MFCMEILLTDLVVSRARGCVYMLIFKMLASALPPGSARWGDFWNSGFPVEHLTLSRSLPLVHHHKETAAPHSSFSRVTIVTRARKKPGL